MTKNFFVKTIALLLVLICFIPGTSALAATDISKINLTINNFTSKYIYAGFEIEQTKMTLEYNSKTLMPGQDYTLEYSDNVNVGEATMKIKGEGAYTGERTMKFTIIPRSIEDFSFSSIPDAVYTGSEITISASSVLCQTTKPNGEVYKYYIYKDTDYTFSYENNVNVGTATLTIEGIGNFNGSKALDFNITPADISGAKASDISDCVYTGSAITPEPSLSFNNIPLKKNVDYTLSYQNNVKAGKASVIITGKGNFSSVKTVDFNINVESVSMDESDMRLRCKSTAALSVKTEPANAYEFKWSSSNPNIVHVDENGKITALRMGTATITAESSDGKYTFSRKVSVYYEWWQWVIIIALFGWYWYI